MTQTHPLSWPHGWPRTTSYERRRASFGKTQTSGSGWKSKAQLSIADGLRRLMEELDRLGVEDGSVVVSTNLKLRVDGLPRSDQGEPSDNGVAVYFRLLGKDQVLACDKWDRAADNIAAIAAHIDAIRRQERYGVGTMAQAFAGYAALPHMPAEAQKRSWFVVLGVAPDAPLSECEAAYKRAAKDAHPDFGGSSEKMAVLNDAIREARRRG